LIFPFFLFFLLQLTNLLQVKDSFTPLSNRKILSASLILNLIFLLYTIYIAYYFTALFTLFPLFGDSDEVTKNTLENFRYLLMIFMGLNVATIISTLLLSFKKYPKVAYLVPLVLILFNILLSQIFTNKMSHLDVYKSSLNSAANLDTKVKAKDIKIAFIDTNNTIEYFTYPLHVDDIPTILTLQEKQELELTPQNILKLEKYIDTKEYKFYTSSAWSAILRYYKTTWNLDAYREISLQNILHKGNLLNAIFLIKSAEALPVNEQNRKFLERLSDESIFHIQNDVALILTKEWIAFGELQKAKHLYEKVVFHNENSFQTFVKEYSFNKGKISGKVDSISTLTKIALVYLPKESQKLLNKPSSFYNIKAVKTLDKNGEFEFTNLIKGEYALALSFEDTKMKIIKIDTAKSLIITPKQSSYDVNIWLGK